MPARAPAATDPAALKERLRAQALALGFQAFGVAPVNAELRAAYYRQWLADGRHGTMAWMADDLRRRLDPAEALPGALAVVCVGLNYFQPEPPRRGRLAKYALGGDYHDLIWRRLKRLCATLRAEGHANRPYVDTGPALEKPLAAAAGLGWQGKSTILLHRRLGTWLFLGEVLTTAPLPPDAPAADHCGRCVRCLDACPTRAITAPYQLDARRCLAYLTVEHAGPIPPEFRRALADRLFGCDDCLDACPWNRWAERTREARFTPRDWPDPAVMLRWTEEEFLAAATGTPLKRLGRERWARNCAVVLGNIGTAADLHALAAARDLDTPLVAEHAAWAMAEIAARP